MDNNHFDNEFFGFEPQKPVTERDSAQPQQEPVQPAAPVQPPYQEPQEPAAPVQPPYREPQPFNPVQPVQPSQPVPPVQSMYQFEPQNPFKQEQPVQPAQPAQPFRQEEPAFNPIQHTAVYDDNGFVQQPQQPPVPQPYAQPYQQNYYQPRQQQPYYQQPQQTQPKQKSKANTALIVVIIIMGVLLLGSMFGLFAFAMNAADNQTKSRSSKSDSFEIPDFTFPNGGFVTPEVPSTTAPVHNESNYSDKADKNYAGLTLADKPADAETNKSYNAENAFNAVSPSVVSVLCYSGDVEENAKATSQGSGIIISADGFIVTNSHVIGNSKTAYAIKVITADNKEYTAGVVGFDSRTDLAVLKLDGAKDLKAAAFGNSDQILLGDDIIIIGNPGGIEYQNSMTKGIVSALNRDASSKNIVKYIQTDAAINPGNSGGPAVNLYGQVIGIASAKIADEKYEGMGFCIPSVQAKQIVDSLIKNSYVEGRVKIGISGNAVSASDVMQYNVPQGILVYSIDKDGPCDNTDLKENDIITALDGEMVTSFADMYELLEKHKPGDKVTLKYYSQSDSEQHEVEITLQEDKR